MTFYEARKTSTKTSLIAATLVIAQPYAIITPLTLVFKFMAKYRVFLEPLMSMVLVVLQLTHMMSEIRISCC